MGIDYSKFRANLTVRKMIAALIKDGFVPLRRRSGGHQQYWHPIDGREVTVTIHPGSDTFTPKTLKSMIETQAQWNEADLRRLKLLK